MKKRLFFFLMFLFVTALSFSAATPEASGFDPETLVVKANWLYVDLGEDDYDTAGQAKKISFVEGGGGLVNFTNLGIISVSEDKEHILFKSEGRFTFEVTANTFTGPYDIFPEMDLDKIYEESFFKAKHYGLFLCCPTHSNTYYARWHYVDLGTTKNFFEFSNPLPITVGIKTLRSTAGSFELNGVTYEVPMVKGDLIGVTVKNVTYGTIGNYSSEFQDVAGVQSAQVKIKPFDELGSGSRSASSAVIDYYNDANLGWQVGPVKRGATLIQHTIGGDQPGAQYHNPDPLNQQMFTFDLGLVLAPEVYEWVQYNNLTKATVKFYDVYSWQPPEPTYGPTTVGAPKRLVGIQVINVYLHWEFVVDVEFYADLQLSAQFSDLILSDPILSKGDWVWDTSVVGDYDVEEPFPSFNNPWVNFFVSLGSLVAALTALLWVVIILIIVKRIPKIKKKIVTRKSS